MSLDQRILIRRILLNDIFFFPPSPPSYGHLSISYDYYEDISQLSYETLLILSKIAIFRSSFYEYTTNRYYRDSYQLPRCENWGSNQFVFKTFKDMLRIILRNHKIKYELFEKVHKTKVSHRNKVELLFGFEMPELSCQGAKCILRHFDHYTNHRSWDFEDDDKIYIDEMLDCMLKTCSFKEELMTLMWSPQKLGLEYFQE